MKNLRFLISFLRVNADIYVQRTLDPASGIISILCKLLGKRLVYMTAADKELDDGYAINKNRIEVFLANLVFKYADVIIVQNTNQKELLHRNKSRDSFLIKSGFLITDYKVNKDKYILWAGRSEKIKRPDLFIKLAEQNPSFEFKMVCPKRLGDSMNYYRSLQQNAIKLKNLEFIEYVPFDKIDKYFRKARILVNTSDREGFPNTFIQAAKNKVPIISLNANPGSLFTKHYCGFCCDNSFKLMNECLNKLFCDKKLYKKMSESAYKYAKENHDIKKNMKQLYDLLMDCMSVKK